MAQAYWHIQGQSLPPAGNGNSGERRLSLKWSGARGGDLCEKTLTAA